MRDKTLTRSQSARGVAAQSFCHHRMPAPREHDGRGHGTVSSTRLKAVAHLHDALSATPVDRCA